ncbi:hypothetical protein CASFOL_016742 [Castilleja foliolosa]|uniref:Peptidase A1 domain-containing protein n=1 Tax=Castilleja foliolosa TaxID=1961234 RepID=A0ABD3D931_9LAMI
MHQEMYLKALMLYLLTWITVAYQPDQNFIKMKTNSGAMGSSIFFNITGNVYPLGYYTVEISIGDPPTGPYVFNIDSGTDHLTWFNCFGSDYVLVPDNLVSCDDRACASLGGMRMDGDCAVCKYNVNYTESRSSTGLLVKDSFHLQLNNGTMIAPRLAFGCGVPKSNEVSIHQPIKDGVLGLGKGEPSILKQLHNISVVRNVVGHCLSNVSGGYIFFGYHRPISGVVWKKILSSAKQYSLGKANILLGDEATDIKGLDIIFNTGNTYTYLKSEAYNTLLDLVYKNINGKLSDANDDKTLPVCWKDVMPIQTIAQVASAFLSITLNFTDDVNNVVQFEMLPESYLIVTDKYNVCLGILNGTGVGLEDMSVIGDISMQNKLVIYDNENEMVGWAAVDTCSMPTTSFDQ